MLTYDDVKFYSPEEKEKQEMLTLQEASLIWGIARETIQKRINSRYKAKRSIREEFEVSDIGCQQGKGRGWLVSAKGMERVFGKPGENRSMSTGRPSSTGIRGLRYTASRKEYAVYFKKKVIFRSRNREKAIEVLRKAQAGEIETNIE